MARTEWGDSFSFLLDGMESQRASYEVLGLRHSQEMNGAEKFYLQRYNVFLVFAALHEKIT